MKKITLILAFLIAIIVKANAQWIEPSQVAWNSQNVYSLISDGTNIYAGTGGAGVSLSNNNGNSWTAVNNGLTSTGISSFAINGTNVFAAGEGVFLTTNNGGLWTSVSNGLTNTTVNALAISGSNIFAGTNGGVFLSSNNGGLWTAANTGFTSQVRTLAISGANIFAGASNYGVYLSSNNGGLWTLVNNGLTNIDVVSLAISGTNIFVGTSGGVFISSNNGGLWTAVNNGLTNLNVYSLLVEGTTIFAGTDDGVFYSNNMGANWTSLNNGFPANTAVQAFTVSGTYIFAGIRLYPYGVWRRPLSDATSGIKDNYNNNNFNLYPNPASDFVTLNIDNSNHEEAILNIYNIIGELIRSETIQKNQQQINVGNLNNGIYVLEIKSNGWSEKQKLMIQR
ncbi:MAG: T9SS type A sorting domain-containing protein [Bacteroidetes bacterium]|nr:T9SS type A sorting domain-containing protein [Bacteroidota bacterium]